MRVGARAGSGCGTEVRAVLLDALGTLVRLEPPGPRLRAELLRATGADVGEEAAARAFRAEIAYYLDHHLEGRDARGLAALRERCAAVLARSLAVQGLGPAEVLRPMLAALSFASFADARPALCELRARDLRLIVTSNWDCSLGEVLARAGLAGSVDGVVSSAEAGGAKPAPEPFLAALRLAGAEPGRAVHVGDSPANDVGGARAAGIRPVLLDRGGGGREAEPRAAAVVGGPREVQTITTLSELPPLI